MESAVRKAVIPAAGLGTRFLPATKATPKEMLPVVDKPAIQYVVEEAVRAGCADILMVTGRNKGSLEDHFDGAPELEAALERKGDKDRLAAVQATNDLGAVHFVRQHEPRGLGHAVLCAAPHVGDEPFAVLLGDDLIDEREDLLQRMITAQAKHGGSVVALLEVPREQIKLYGAAVAREPDGDGVVRIDDLVEKPDPGDAPSTLAVIGRYVLSAAVFEELRRTEPGAGGEIQLTDALKALAQRPDADREPVHGVVFTGRRYDTGDRGDYLRTIVTLASERADLGPEFMRWLREFVAGHPNADQPNADQPNADQRDAG